MTPNYCFLKLTTTEVESYLQVDDANNTSKLHAYRKINFNEQK